MPNQIQIDCIRKALESYTMKLCRQQSLQLMPMLFKFRHLIHFIVQDNQNFEFKVQQKHLDGFMNQIENQKIRYVKVLQWEFEFDMKQNSIREIYFNSTTFNFIYQNKQQHQIIGLLRFRVYPNRSYFTLNTKTLGYLNRLGKIDIIKNSYNRIYPWRFLIHFLQRPIKSRNRFSLKKNQKEIDQKSKEKKIRESKQKQQKILNLLNEEGIEILKKLQRLYDPKQLYTHALKLGIKDKYYCQYLQNKLAFLNNNT